MATGSRAKAIKRGIFSSRERGSREHAMSEKLNTAIAVIGIDISTTFSTRSLGTRITIIPEPWLGPT